MYENKIVNYLKYSNNFVLVLINKLRFRKTSLKTIEAIFIITACIFLQKMLKEY